MRTVALALLLLAAPLAAQEPPVEAPTPAAFDLAPLPDAVPLTESSVEDVGGAPVAIVPAPPEVPSGLVADVAEQTAENFKAVASGDVEPEETTRDPAKTADSGAGYLFPVLLAFAAAVTKYVIGEAVRRHPTIGNSTIGMISHGTTLLIVAVGFFALHRVSPDLPQDIATWLTWSGLGQAGGSMASSAKAVSIHGASQQGAKP
jgi:hypothetical protein